MDQIKELTTAQITGRLVQEDLTTAVPGSALTLLEFTLLDRDTGLVLNGHDDEDILGATGVDVDESGNVTVMLVPDDNVIVDDARLLEVHRAQFYWQWNKGGGLVGSGRAYKDFQVENLVRTP